MRIEDTFQHKGLRKALVQKLSEKGIDDPKVLKAIGKVPRHLFFEDTIFEKTAYEDLAFPIGLGQTISQPYTVAYQSQLLDLQPTDKILEIGTGSGYQAAVLAEMGVRVYSIERQKGLYERTRSRLLQLKYPLIKCFFGDGFEGLPAYAPFDKIIITAAAPEIPKTLIEQLKPAGLMVIPYGSGKTQQMLRIHKLADGSLQEEVFEDFAFVPMLKGKAF